MNTISKKTISYKAFKENLQPTLKNLDSSYKNAWNYVSFLNNPIAKEQILYECSQGETFSGIPKLIFDIMSKKSSFIHIICLKKKFIDDFKEKYNFPNVVLVSHGSKEYFKNVAVSKYLVSDHYMMSNFSKRPEQNYLFTGDMSMVPSSSYDKKIQFDMRHCLQADAILSFHKQYKEDILKNTYKLQNIYTKSIIDKPEDCSMEEYIKEVISIFFYNKCSEIVSNFISNKKKLLFWMDFSSTKEKSFEFLDLLNYLSHIDYTNYDVTLLVPYIPMSNLLILSSIHPQIRFMDQSGRIPFSKEEYVQYSYLKQYLMYFNNITAATNPACSHMKMLKRNLQRLWGDTIFDAFYYFGELKNEPFLLTCACQAKEKNFIRTDSPKSESHYYHFSEDREFVYKNRCSLYQSFHHIYFYNKSFLLEALNSNPEVYKHADFVERVPGTFSESMSFSFIKEVTYNNSPYLMLPLNKISAPEPHVLLSPLPADTQEALLHVVTDSCLEIYQQLINDFLDYQCKHPSAYLYIVDNYNIFNDIAFKKMNFENNSSITFVRYTPIIQEYVSHFHGLMPLQTESSVNYHKHLSDNYHKFLILG